MRLVFSIVALTGLLGLSLGENDTTEIAGLELSNIEMTVADFPGAEPTPKVDTVFSPFERTAMWAVGLFVTESPVQGLTEPESIDVTYVDLTSQVPETSQTGAHAATDLAD